MQPITEEHLISLKNEGITSFPLLEKVEIEDLQVLLKHMAYKEYKEIHGVQTRHVKDSTFTTLRESFCTMLQNMYPGITFDNGTVYNIQETVTIPLRKENGLSLYIVIVGSLLLSCYERGPTKETFPNPGDSVVLDGEKCPSYSLTAKEESFVIGFQSNKK